MLCELMNDCYTLPLELKFRNDCNCEMQFVYTNADPS